MGYIPRFIYFFYYSFIPQMGLTRIEQFVIDKVKDKRIQMKISGESLSKSIGLNEKFVAKVENPSYPDKYNLNHLNKIAEVLGCSIKDFLPDKPLPGEIPKRQVKREE